jgi:hypothetical protein
MKHQEIIELLPWYVNATLNQAERKLVEAHLDGCTECANEVRSLTAMRKAIVAVGDEAPEPSQFLLNRALAQIEDYERAREQAESTQAEKSGKWYRHFSAVWEDWFGKTPVFARMALAVQMALLLAVGTVAVYQNNHPEVIVRGSFATQTGPNGQTSSHATIGIIFNESASEREIRQALEAVHGKIVGGPSAQRRYAVELTDLSKENTAEIEKVLQKLRQNKRVIRDAQQVLTE